MTNPIIRIHNAQTGEVIDRPMTDAEYAADQAQTPSEVARSSARKEKEIARAALLNRLGITSDEADLLS